MRSDAAMCERAPASAPRGRSDEGGFALAMVVFLLFTIAVAGATGYQLVSAENELASGNEAQEEALAVARAGLERYVGEHLGIPGVTSYALGDGSVTVTPYKVTKLNDSTDVYLLRAVGTLPDARYPSSPATRTVRQYAHLNRRPVRARAAFMTTQPTMVLFSSNTSVDGMAEFSLGGSAVTDCPTGDATGIVPIAGAISTSSVGGPGVPTGSPGDTILPNPAAVISAARVRWSVLKDPSFPIPFDGSWPNFASIPGDSFPVVRVDGDYTLDRNGRGALIVTGSFTASGTYEWRGIILAGGATSSSYDNGSGEVMVQGIIISGLNGSTFSGNQQLRRFHAEYFPCYVRKANLSLAYLTLIDGARWEF
jgi:hypothetical protein